MPGFRSGADGIASPEGYIGIPAVFLIVFDFIIPMIWLKSQRPMSVAITPDAVTLTSMPIMGFGGGRIVQRNLSEFKKIDAYYSLGPMIDRVDRVILRANPGYKDITIDVSLMKNTVVYAKQLSEMLNLPVNLCPCAVNLVRS